ncbi:MAG TPA: hypothetical protein VNC50_15795 [Planctomycetia bacterium]|nr:hypothetical protein [Planctomycetia bacterium]
MNQPPQVVLYGFERCEALGSIFELIGLPSEPGLFLHSHLTGVLRKQHPDVVISTLELVAVPDCDMGGFMTRAAEMMRVESMRIPIEVLVQAVVNGKPHGLRIDLFVNAKGENGRYVVTTDMHVREQGEWNPEEPG